VAAYSTSGGKRQRGCTKHRRGPFGEMHAIQALFGSPYPAQRCLEGQLKDKEV